MAKNITIAGADYPDVPSITVTITGGGYASFVDTSDATATAADIALNKTAYVNGVKITGTATSGGGSSSYSLTYPTNLVNQSLTLGHVSTDTDVSGTYTASLPHVSLSLVPSTGYNAGTIILDGVDTGLQVMTISDDASHVVTCSEATQKSSDYIMDATLTVGYGQDSNNNWVYGFSTEDGFGSVVNGTMEYEAYGSTQIKTLDKFYASQYGGANWTGSLPMAVNIIFNDYELVISAGTWSTYISDGQVYQIFKRAYDNGTTVRIRIMAAEE